MSDKLQRYDAIADPGTDHVRNYPSPDGEFYLAENVDHRITHLERELDAVRAVLEHVVTKRDGRWFFNTRGDTEILLPAMDAALLDDALGALAEKGGEGR